MIVTENGQNFVLKVPTSKKEIVANLMAYRGLAFSTSASSRDEAVLFSTNPYSLADMATEENKQLFPYKQEIEKSRALDGKGTKRLPAGIELWDYQRATLDYLLERKGGINGDQPGLGKTITSIAYCNEREAQRVLVIVPASVRIQWGEQIKRFSTIPNVNVSVMLKVKDGIHPTSHYQVLSYDAARNPAIMRAIAKYRWNVMICDEAHKMKNIDALTTRAILGNSRGEYQHGDIKMKAIASYCDEHLSLTGTLLLNRPSECLAGSTLVLTKRGWVPIVRVRKSDLLWDGVEWVEHHGLLYQGCAPTVNVGRISATATHRFLAKSTWVSADEVHQSTDLWNQLLVRGSENLPSEVLGGMQATLSTWTALATAAAKQRRLLKNYVKVMLFGADRAVQKMGLKKPTQSTMQSVLTSNYVNATSTSSNLCVTDVPTQKTRLGNLTEVEEYVSSLNGSTIAQPFWSMLFHYLILKSRVCNWIVGITIEAMSREICGLSAEKKTWAIVELSQIYKSGWIWPWKKMKCSEPVYDIANAGPRQRFTVLTCDGPVIAHNCYNLFRFHDHEAIEFMSEDKFKNRYNRQADLTTIEGKRFKLESTSLEHELQNRLRVNVLARHEKKDVLSMMKPPRYSVVRCEENSTVKSALDAEGMLGISLDEIQTTKDFEILGHIAQVRRLMGVALAPQIAEYAKDFLEGSDEKLTIFGWHIEVLDIFEQELAKYGTVRVDGRKSPTARQKAVDDFISDDNVRVFVGNIQSAGTGLDGLQKVCSRCYLAEPDWVPAQNEQAVSRLDRFGQENVVSAEIFVAPGSISEKILVRAIEKMNTIYEVMDAKSS